MYPMEHIWTIVMLEICKHTFYAYLSQIWKMMQYTRFIWKVFATKILLSGKFSFFATLVEGKQGNQVDHWPRTWVPLHKRRRHTEQKVRIKAPMYVLPCGNWQLTRNEPTLSIVIFSLESIAGRWGRLWEEALQATQSGRLWMSPSLSLLLCFMFVLSFLFSWFCFCLYFCPAALVVSFSLFSLLKTCRAR